MQTSVCFSPKAYSQQSKGFNSWWLWRSGHRHTRQKITWGKPFLYKTWRRPSELRVIVTHFDGWPGFDSALSSSLRAPFFFFSFFTKVSIAFSAHFSSSSPCFQPSSLFTAGVVNEKSEAIVVISVKVARLLSPENDHRDSIIVVESLAYINTSLPFSHWASRFTNLRAPDTGVPLSNTKLANVATSRIFLFSLVTSNVWQTFEGTRACKGGDGLAGYGGLNFSDHFRRFYFSRRDWSLFMWEGGGGGGDFFCFSMK